MDEIIWNSFKEWAEDNGVDLNDESNYMNYWICWKVAWETANSI